MNEFRTDDDVVRINVPYAEVYIPSDLVENPEDKTSPIACRFGDGFQTIGIFYIKIFESEDQPREKALLKTFIYPNVMETYPTVGIQKDVNLQLSPELAPDKYWVLKYQMNDIMMSAYSKQASQNCERFLNLLIKGKLPSGISYDDLMSAWDKNLEINAVDPGVPSIIKQMIISENCRSKKDPRKQFRKEIGKDPKISKTAYVVNNMVEVAANNSVVSALTFERFGDMLTTSLNMSKSGEPQVKSPLEKVLTM